MASDNRDWYRDWWRKKTRYVEKASFRMSQGERERQRYRSAWGRNLRLVAALVLIAVVVIVFKRLA